MNKYVGVKMVEAKPMNIGDYNMFRGWTIPEDEIPSTEGYLVIYPDGYKSWCPKEQFEEANRPVDGMTFGHANECLKKGFNVARVGWNGKGMWLKLIKRGYYDVALSCVGDTNPTLLPWIGMKTADNGFVPWLASQTDILAEDWQVVE